MIQKILAQLGPQPQPLPKAPAREPAPTSTAGCSNGSASHEALALEDSAPGVATACAAGAPVVAVRSADTRDDGLGGVLADLPSLEAVRRANLRTLQAVRAPR